MKKILFVTLLIPSFVQAGFFSGNELKENCNKTTGSYDRGICHGYVAAVADIGNTVLFCLPSKVTLGQMSDLVIKYMNENPAQLHKSADSIAVSAISKDFPCKKM